MSKRKYKRGNRIERIDEIANSPACWYEVDRPCGCRMWHARALMSLQTKVLNDWVKSGWIYEAKQIEMEESE